MPRVPRIKEKGMAEENGPPRIGGGVGKAVKKNKLLVGLGAVGGLIYFLSKKGADSGSGDGQVIADVQPVQLAPAEASDAQSEVIQRYAESQDATMDRQHELEVQERADAEAQRQREYDAAEAQKQRDFEAAQSKQDAATSGAGDPSSPTDPPVDDTNDAAIQTGTGVTIAGKAFPGATGHRMNGGGDSAAGHYVTHTVVYPGKTEQWNHYVRDKNKKPANFWRGPFGVNVTSSTQTPAAPAPTAAPSAPATTSGPAHPPSGYTAGDPGGVLGAFGQFGVGWRKTGTGKTGRGSYDEIRMVFKAGPSGSWVPVVYHKYTSGEWKGQWHKV
jgi:hypothetical protein